MYMNLKCPACGFAFGVGTPDDITEKEKRSIMLCPCGAMMELTDELQPNLFDDGDQPNRGVEI